MDIVELSQRHGPLLERILAKATGPLGEILVADALVSQGYIVQPLNNNRRQCDLLVTSPSGLSFFVEVKSDRSKRPTWFVRRCPDPEASAIWCFVSAPREATSLPDPDKAEIFVLTAREAAALWNASEWNQQHPDNGDIRRRQIPDEARNAWGKLPP